ncbi:hypothetical protein ACWDOX_40660, partial [Streptomyces sp. NPDC003710]
MVPLQSRRMRLEHASAEDAAWLRAALDTWLADRCAVSAPGLLRNPGDAPSAALPERWGLRPHPVPFAALRSPGGASRHEGQPRCAGRPRACGPSSSKGWARGAIPRPALCGV